MELPKLYQFVFLIVIVGMLLGIGILSVDKLGIAAKTDTTITEETVAITSGAGQTAFDDLVSVSYFGNQSLNSTDPLVVIGNNVAGAEVNWTASGIITVDQTNFSNGDYNITYVYERDSAATTATSNVNTELGTIASTWLGLIITIAVLAIIISLIVSSFAFKGR